MNRPARLAVPAEVAFAEKTLAWFGCIFQGDLSKPPAHLTGVMLPEKTRDADVAVLVKHLRQLPKLRELSILAAKITDEALKHLTALDGLTSLMLPNNWRITDAGAKHLAQLPSLQQLDLYGTRVGDAGLKELSAFKELQRLHIGHTLVSDAGLKHLAGLPELIELGLGGSSISGTGFKDHGGFAKLATVNLNHASVSDAGLKAIATLPALKKLWIAGARISSASLTELAVLKHLEELDLGNAYTSGVVKVDEAGIEAIARIASLRRLACVFESEDVAKKLRKTRPDLEFLK
jgi:Leucine-rich repeat (LRR) protein